jgi:hypothetical protein
MYLAGWCSTGTLGSLRMDPLMKLGFEKDLEMDDLWDLKKSDTAAFNRCPSLTQRNISTTLGKTTQTNGPVAG